MVALVIVNMRAYTKRCYISSVSIALLTFVVVK